MLIAAKINWDKTIEVEVQQKIHSLQQVSNTTIVCYGESHFKMTDRNENSFTK